MIKVGSDFSGVGAFNQALIRLGIKYEEVFACDMDKYARQTFILNYGEPKYYPENVYDRDIPSESLDIFMTSPPCQSFSLAGKRKGEDSKNGVLFYNSHEFIVKNNPRYFIFENVKGLLSDDSGKTFQKWIDYLGGKSVNGNPVIFPHEESVPYHVYYQVMNAKHYGVPQNRERIFIIGIRDDADNDFSFPKPFPLEKRLKDVLESEVDEKYFLSDKMVNVLTHHQNKITIENDNPEQSATIHAGYFKMGGRDQQYVKDAKIGAIRGRNPTNPLSRVSGLPTEQMLEINENGTSNALTTVQKDNVVVIPANNSKGYDIAEEEEDSINFSNPNSETRRGRVGKGVAQTLDTSCNQGVLVSTPAPIVEYQLTGGKWDKTHEQSGRVYDKNGIAPTIHTMGGGNQEPKVFADEIIVLNDATHSQQRIYSQEGISPSILSGSNGGGQNPCKHLTTTQRIRRLTPRECANLMDFPETMKFDVSDSQIYKQMGNSIVVGVLALIIEKLKL